MSIVGFKLNFSNVATVLITAAIIWGARSLHNIDVQFAVLLERDKARLATDQDHEIRIRALEQRK